MKNCILWWTFLLIVSANAKSEEDHATEEATPVGTISSTVPSEKCEAPPSASAFLKAPLHERIESSKALSTAIKDKITFLKNLNDTKAVDILNLEAKADKVHTLLTPEKIKQDKMFGGALAIASAAMTYGGHRAIKHVFKNPSSAHARWNPKTVLTATVVGVGFCGMTIGANYMSDARQNRVKAQAIKDLQELQLQIDELVRELELEKKARNGIESLVSP